MKLDFGSSSKAVTTPSAKRKMSPVKRGASSAKQRLAKTSPVRKVVGEPTAKTVKAKAASIAAKTVDSGTQIRVELNFIVKML